MQLVQLRLGLRMVTVDEIALGVGGQILTRSRARSKAVEVVWWGRKLMEIVDKGVVRLSQVGRTLAQRRDKRAL